MQIVLGNVKEDKFHFRKTITNEITVECSIIEPFDLENPQITLTSHGKGNYNYCYFSFGGQIRYYYIVKKIVSKHNIIFELELDYFKTFANEILSSVAHITRSNRGDLYLTDNLAKVRTQKQVVFRNLGGTLGGRVSYIMVKGK